MSNEQCLPHGASSPIPLELAMLPSPKHLLPYIQIGAERDHHATPTTTLVPVPRRIILRADNQPSTFSRALIDRLNDINQLLFILQDPVQFIIIPRTKITHHMFIPEEEHDGDGVVQLIHLVEIRHFVDIAKIDDSEVFDLVSDSIENLILPHTIGVPIPTEANDDETVLFRHDSLVDVPSSFQVRQNDGTHF